MGHELGMDHSISQRDFLRLSARFATVLAVIPLHTACSSLRPPQASDPPPPDVGPMPNPGQRTFFDSLIQTGLEALGRSF
jgi:hypothetical protein